jgi:hypothetical protein
MNWVELLQSFRCSKHHFPGSPHVCGGGKGPLAPPPMICICGQESWSADRTVKQEGYIHGNKAIRRYQQPFLLSATFLTDTGIAAAQM